MIGTTFDDMREELNRAHTQNVIVYFHIGKVPGPTSFISEVFYFDNQFNVYIVLKSQYLSKEDALKKYLRQKYGHIIRLIAVEIRT